MRQEIHPFWTLVLEMLTIGIGDEKEQTKGYYSISISCHLIRSTSRTITDPFIDLVVDVVNIGG